MKLLKYTCFIIMGTLMACDDLLELEPKGEIIAEEALQTPQDMQELLNAAYDALRGEGGDFLGGRVQAISEVMADNIDGSQNNLNDADFRAYYDRSSSFFTGYTQNMFDEPHFVIYRSNVLLQNLDILEGSNDANRIEGEAKLLRAFCYFELIRLFAHPYGFTPENTHLGVVLRTEPSPEARDRDTVAEVYAQIVQDLEDATTLLPDENGVYADSWAAKAILSKVYFHMHNFQRAFDLANDVIENGPYAFNTSADEFTERFSPGGSDEAIFFMISNVNDHRGTQFTTHFRSDGDNPPTLRISEELHALATSNPSDLRAQWYDVSDEGAQNQAISITKFDGVNFFNVPLLHVTEVKFIRAEAGAELNQPATLATAIGDVNDIRVRAGLTPLPGSTSQTTLLSTLRTEKRLELVAEGQRFHDLRRRGVNGESTLKIRGANWDCPGMAIQFPDIEIAGAGGTDVFTPNQEGGC
ncbi:RagB/SusD family nutrient uptake outer membrane protein [Fulvivirga sp. M361]|uniref:RagB/SusD family nutrient uptake outer membrane protein n=1 Tax=Fulvivirga sp. M361 TaxID=2594266 RepID=UPI0016273C12|nr:RagB/SusD family nutrient uptake outer membrane protein [Fulvivirga sp. M361]